MTTQLQTDVIAGVAAGVCTVEDRGADGIFAVFVVPAIEQAAATTQPQLGAQYNRKAAVSAKTSEIRLDAASDDVEDAWYTNLIDG